MLYTKMLLIFTQNFLWVGAIIKKSACTILSIINNSQGDANINEQYFNVKGADMKCASLREN